MREPPYISYAAIQHSSQTFWFVSESSTWASKNTLQQISDCLKVFFLVDFYLVSCLFVRLIASFLHNSDSWNWMFLALAVSVFAGWNI